MAAGVAGHTWSASQTAELLDAYPDNFSIVLSQQHVGLLVPGQSAGAPFVTVTSQPHWSSGQRYASPSLNAMTHLSVLKGRWRR